MSASPTGPVQPSSPDGIRIAWEDLNRSPVSFCYPMTPGWTCEVRHEGDSSTLSPVRPCTTHSLATLRSLGSSRSRLRLVPPVPLRDLDSPCVPARTWHGPLRLGAILNTWSAWAPQVPRWGHFGSAKSCLGGYGQSAGQIWLEGVGCTGSEPTIDKCTHGAWGQAYQLCTHREDTAVWCSNTPIS